MKTLTDLAAHWLPAGVRRPLRGLIEAPARFAYLRALAARPFMLPRGLPVLNYGGALPRKQGALVHGGRVKLTHLDRAFPESALGFNVLYLVSSAIPRHALDLVRFAKKRGVKFVWNQNGVAYPAWSGQFTEDVNGPMRTLLMEADFVIYQSVFCRASADRFLGVAQCPSDVLFNAVDLAFFRPAKTPLPTAEIRLLAMGTHTYAERVRATLRCLAELHRMGREGRLTIAGRLQWPQAEKEIRRAIAELGLHDNVTFRPAFSQTEAADLCRAHHILLHPKYMDPCPTVVIEALACGLPVVGLASGGLPELVGTEAGRLLAAPEDWKTMPAPNAEAMAAAVIAIADDWANFSACARQRAEALFDAKHWMECHRQIFEQLLGPS